MTTPTPGTGSGQQGGTGTDPGTGQDPAGTAPKPTAPPFTAPTPTAPQQQPQQAPQQQAEPSTDDGGQDTAATIARLERDLDAARKEAAKGRTTAKQRAADEARQELAQQLAAVLDPSKANEPADPEELTRQLTAEQAKARQTAVELAVYRTARDAGGDPDALLDSRQFAAAVADLDPADLDGIKAAVTAAVQANPKLAAEQQGPTRGGVEFSGAPSGGVSPEQFAAMGYAERAQLFQSDPDTYRRLAGS